jgi:hypothetical protein
MEKRNKIIYWIATIWLSLGMVSSGIVQAMNAEKEIQFIINLGYPVYVITFLGVLKLAGVIVVLLPRLPLLKEWAYAGFFFSMLGAAYSHIAVGNPASEVFPPLLLITLTMVSWYFRPAGRKFQRSTPQPATHGLTA